MSTRIRRRLQPAHSTGNRTTLTPTFLCTRDVQTDHLPLTPAAVLPTSLDEPLINCQICDTCGHPSQPPATSHVWPVCVQRVSLPAQTTVYRVFLGLNTLLFFAYDAYWGEGHRDSSPSGSFQVCTCGRAVSGAERPGWGGDHRERLRWCWRCSSDRSSGGRRTPLFAPRPTAGNDPGDMTTLEEDGTCNA